VTGASTLLFGIKDSLCGKSPKEHIHPSKKVIHTAGTQISS